MQTHEILLKYLDKKKSSTPGFSLRSLARRMDLSPSFLSRVFAGKKPIPYALMLRLAKQLDIEPELLSVIKEAHQHAVDGEQAPRKGRAKMQSPLEDWDLAGKNDLAILRQWFYLPILEMMSLADYDGSVSMIAERLRIAPTTAAITVRELIALGLLTEKDGRLGKVNRKLRFGSAKSLREIRQFHSQMLGKAQEELRDFTEEADFARRLITGITLTAAPSKIEAARRKLAECLHEIANDLTEDEGTEVFHLSAQLFPLTKPKK